MTSFSKTTTRRGFDDIYSLTVSNTITLQRATPEKSQLKTMTDDEQTLRDRVDSLEGETDAESARAVAAGWRRRIDELGVPVWLWNLIGFLGNLGLIAAGVLLLQSGPVGMVVGGVLVLVGAVGVADAARNRYLEARARVGGD